jgi:UrcA family protein
MNRNLQQRVVLLGVALLCAGVALADPIGSGSSVTLRYSDLDLSRPDGALRLYEGIEAAAGKVCDGYHRSTFAGLLQYRECYRKAVDDAVRKVGSDKLTALHRDHTKGAFMG